MKYKKIIQLFVLVLLFIGFVYIVLQNKEEFLVLKIKNIWYSVPALGCMILFYLTNGYISKVLLDIFHIRLPFMEWFGLSLINAMGNMLAPFRGGSVANAVYLKKKYRFPYSKFVSNLSALYIIIFWVNSLIGIISCIYIYLNYDVYDIVISSFFVLLFIFLSGVILLSPHISLTSHYFINIPIKVINGWWHIKNHKKEIVLIAGAAFLNIIQAVGITYFEFLVFGITVPLEKVLFLSVVSTLSLFLSITPGSLGIKEAFALYTASVLYVPLSEMIAVSILERLFNLIIVFTLGPFFSYLLIGRSMNKEVVCHK